MKGYLLTSMVAAALLTTAHASNNDSVEVPLAGQAIASLSVSLNNVGIIMPDVVAPTSGDANATVTLNCNSDGSSSVAYTGNSNPYAHGTANETVINDDSANKADELGNYTGTCASLAVYGQSGYNYKAFMLRAPSYSSPFEPSLITCNVDADGSGVIGTDGLYCGARVTITSAAGGSSMSYATSGHGVVAVVYD